MTTIALHQPPSLGAVFRAYCRSLFIAYRRIRWVIATLVVLVITGVMIIEILSMRNAQKMQANASANATTNARLKIPASGQPQTVAETTAKIEIGSKREKWFSGNLVIVKTDSRGQSISSPDSQSVDDEMGDIVMAIVWILFGIVVACVLALSTWRDEPVSRRVYHWVMPVERSTHVLVRVFAGWTLLIVMIPVVLGAGYLGANVVCTIVDLVYGGAFAHVMQDVWSATPSEARSIFMLGILFPLAAVTIIYCFVSALAVAVESPGYWIGGIIAAYLVLPLAFRKLSLPAVSAAVTQVWTGHFGLRSALFGVMTPLNFSNWWPVSLLWIGISVAVLIASAAGSAHMQQR